MTNWYKPLVLSSLLCTPWLASAHTECERLFPSTDRIERQKQFIADRDRLIGHFSPDENAKVIADVIRHSTAASNERVVKNALWLKDVPSEVIRHAEELGMTKERAWEVAGEIETEIALLEKKAICYHFTELDYYDADRLMMLKLYDDVNVTSEDTGEQPIAFGYMTTTTDGRSSRVVHLTYPGDCCDRACHFTNIDKDQFKGTGIRLVHHPETIETMVTGLSTVMNGDPALTDLTSLELTKTGEVFTKPEIYAAIYYYGEDVEIDKKSFDRRMMVDIPWALTKGNNLGRTRLLTWNNQTKAHLVIMEDDRDIPFGDIQKVIKLGFRAAIEFLPAGEAIIKFGEALHRVIDNKDSKGDDQLVATLEGWQKNDLIDELVLERSFDQHKSQYGVKGHAVMRLNNMYKEIEKTEEVSSENLATSNEHDETIATKTKQPSEIIDDQDDEALDDDDLEENDDRTEL